MNLYQKLSSGAGPDEELLKSPELKWIMDWSSDGQFILYRAPGLKTNNDIWVLPMGNRNPYPLVHTEFNENWARFSHNGRWVAYVSDETGAEEVYVREFQESSGKWLVSTGGGSFPRWRRDGKELYYTSGGKMMAVEVNASGSNFDARVPKLLFEKPGVGQYDVSGDGQRFLVGVPVENRSPDPITVVLNWTADLKR